MDLKDEQKIWQSWQSFWFSDDQKWHSQILLWLGMGLFNLENRWWFPIPDAQDPQKRKAVEDGGAGLTLPAKRAKGQFIQFIHLLTEKNTFSLKKKPVFGIWQGIFFFLTGSASDGSARTFCGFPSARSTRRWPNKPWRLWKMILNWRSWTRVGRCWVDPMEDALPIFMTRYHSTFFFFKSHIWYLVTPAKWKSRWC